MAQMTDVMVDIETTGKSPDFSGILQIAAVKFNLESGEVDADFFDRSLIVPGNRYWDQDTYNWWSGMPLVLQSIQARAEPPEAVMAALQAWGMGDGCELRFWAKPLSFDYPFVASYFREFGLTNPFFYRIARDVNTYIAALDGGKADHRNIDLPFVGEEHNALYDVFHQIKVLFEARRLAGL